MTLVVILLGVRVLLLDTESYLKSSSNIFLMQIGNLIWPSHTRMIHIYNRQRHDGKTHDSTTAS